MPWTEARIERVRELAGMGWSAAVIAGEIGDTTRNAVVGIGHRKGIKFLGAGGGHVGNGRPRVWRASPRKPKRVIQIEDIVEIPKMVTFLDLGDDDCKWPIGDPLKDDFRFCGKYRLTGMAYCRECCRIAYETPQERRARVSSQSGRPGSDRRSNYSLRDGGVV